MKNPHQGKVPDGDVSQCPFMTKKNLEASPFSEKINMQSTEKKRKQSEE